MKYLLVLVGLMLVPPAVTQDGWVKSVLFIDGDCQILLVGKQDMQPVCGTQIIQAIHSDGRIELMVSTDGDDGRFFVLIGQRQGSEGDWPLVQEIVELVVGLDTMGERQKTYKASWHYINDNAHAGPARFLCGISDSAGREYDFAFVSDGSPPENVLE